MSIISELKRRNVLKVAAAYPRWEKILDKMELLEYWERSQAKREDAES